MDDLIAQFTTITGASVSKAESYLKVSDFDLGSAIQLFYDADADQDSPSQPPVRAPAIPPQNTAREPIQIDDDDDDLDDDDLREALRASSPGLDPPAPAPASGGSGSGGNSAYDEDEAMARKLQEEFYAGSAGPGFGGENGVRAPIAKTRETLLEDDYMYSRMRRERPRGN